MMSANGWIEVRVPSAVGADDLTALLDDPDLTGAWEDNGVVHLYWPAARWGPERLTHLSGALARLGGDPTRIAVDTLADTDWNAAWAKSVTPIRIGRRLVIRPSWSYADLRAGDIELILDPKQAFGTGHHATTRLLLEWLEDVIIGGERVFDIGTGSGILALTAVRFGASSAIGIDADPIAIDCARESAAMNGFRKELCFEIGEFGTHSLEAADIVVANLDRATILHTICHLLAAVRQGGTLLMSGLLVDDEAEVRAALKRAGGIVIERRDSEGWIALAVRAAVESGV